jgi:hypothetical protein
MGFTVNIRAGRSRSLIPAFLRGLYRTFRSPSLIPAFLRDLYRTLRSRSLIPAFLRVLYRTFRSPILTHATKPHPLSTLYPAFFSVQQKRWDGIL